MRIIIYIILILTLSISCQDEKINFDINKQPKLDLHIDTITSDIVVPKTPKENNNLALIYYIGGGPFGHEIISIDSTSNFDTINLNSNDEWIGFFSNDSTYKTNTITLSLDIIQNLEDDQDSNFQIKFWIKNLTNYNSHGVINSVLWDQLPAQISLQYKQFKEARISFSADINNDGITDYMINDRYHHEAFKISLFLSKKSKNETKWVKKCIYHIWV